MSENRTLKDALHATIHRHPTKSVAAIAEEIGISENYLYRSALPDQDMDGQGTGCRFPLKSLIPLVRATADFQVLDYIEFSMGRVAVTLPAVDRSQTVGDISRLAMLAAVEFGQLMAAAGKSLDDGEISATEMKRIEREVYEAVQAIMALLMAMKGGKA